MYQSNASSLSAGDRWVIGLMAAGLTFVVGYTVTRVSLASATSTSEGDVQQNVIPHEGELWNHFGG
ncbi:hypothetical protein PN498_13595 [Oscillatoria sp. CS-180]|uniref:hypothetical protein n=1 Tax=Oscillatoria sp. CS-180 TaxID=3021720 RepID=UPI00232E3FAE|nr:hypothetical protein [Oscillatoria sp. CS-180]MDB9527029.1 hypothetical protein [Oscillatoria sp. CS-180]